MTSKYSESDEPQLLGPFGSLNRKGRKEGREGGREGKLLVGGRRTEKLEKVKKKKREEIFLKSKELEKEEGYENELSPLKTEL